MTRHNLDIPLVLCKSWQRGILITLVSNEKALLYCFHGCILGMRPWYPFLNVAYFNRKDTGIGFHDFVIWTRDLLKDSNDVMLVSYLHASILLETHEDIFCRQSESCKRYVRLSNQVPQRKFNPRSLHWCQLLVSFKRIQQCPSTRLSGSTNPS